MGKDQTHGVGSRNGDPGPFDHVDPADVFTDDGPVDITAVRRDDALIEAIAGDGPVATEDADEYQLAMLLASWRAEVHAAPVPEGPDLDTVVAAVQGEIAARAAAQKAKRWRRPLSIAAASVALLTLSGGVATALSYNASPGDPLWTVKQAVFSKQADSTMARMDADTDLDAAEQLLAKGDYAGAKQLLDRASSRAANVSESTQRDSLLNRWNTLVARLSQIAPNATTSLLPPPPPSLEASPEVATDTQPVVVPSLEATAVPTEPPVQAPDTAQLLPQTPEGEPPVIQNTLPPATNPPEPTDQQAPGPGPDPGPTQMLVPVPTSYDTVIPQPPPGTTGPAADTTIDLTAPPTETSTAAAQLPPVTTANSVGPLGSSVAPVSPIPADSSPLDN